MRSIRVTLSLVRNKKKWELWEIGSADVRMGDWERRVAVYQSKTNAQRLMRSYKRKLEKQYGEAITVNII